MNIDLIVTRHTALVALLVERGLAGESTPVISHVSDPSILDGKVVAGVLPLSLAARCAAVVEVPLDLSPDERGKELDLARMREIAGKTTTYVVSKQ